MRLRIAVLALILFAGVSSTIYAQVSSATARKLGLETAWQSQVQLPRVEGGLVSSHIWPESSNPRKYAVVELPAKTIRVSAETLDRDGQPIGIEEAKAQAKLQAARFLGKSDGFQVAEISVPRIKLVLVTRDGLVQTLDAETGKLIWSATCGLSTAPAHPAAISAAGITVVQGETLYLLDWGTGKHLMEKPLRHASANAAAVCSDIAFVSDFTGRVEAYGLSRVLKPWGYVMNGRAVGKTANLASGAFSAIACDTGYVYIFAGGEEPSAWIRYETSSAISGSLAAGNGAFYAGTTGGLMTKISVEDRIGAIKWEFSLGKTVTAPPLVLSSQVIVATESGDVVSIDDSTGQILWSTPLLGVAQAISKVGKSVCCLSSTGQLVALDSEAGTLVARSTPMNLSRPIVNQLNDRVYIVASNGQIQCLRPIGGYLPTMYSTVPISEEEQTPESTVADPAPDDGGNPFNFGGGAAGDAFGGGADPFGGAGDAGMGDPFGGPTGAGSDPFGGDPFGGSGN